MAKKKAENSKATVAKAAKEDRANAKERANAKAAEDAYWEAAGDGARSKSAAKKEQQAQERDEAASRKAELKHLAELEDAEAAAKMAAKSKAAKASSSAPPLPGAAAAAAGGDFPGKVTHHQLRQEAEAEAREREAARRRRLQEATREVAADEYEAALDNHGGSRVNRAVGVDDVDARSLEAAVAVMSVSGTGEDASDDRYPERRARAAFAAYQERELPRLKSDRPGLKLSQYKELVWRAWQKAPENPIYMSGRG